MIRQQAAIYPSQHPKSLEPIAVAVAVAVGRHCSRGHRRTSCLAYAFSASVLGKCSARSAVLLEPAISRARLARNGLPPRARARHGLPGAHRATARAQARHVPLGALRAAARAPLRLRHRHGPADRDADRHSSRRRRHASRSLPRAHHHHHRLAAVATAVAPTAAAPTAAADG